MSRRTNPARWATLRGLALVGLSWVLWACGGLPPQSLRPATPTDIQPSASALMTPQSTAIDPPSTPTPTPSQSIPSGSQLLCAAPFAPCDLAAGTYYALPFEFKFTVTVDSGWTNNRNDPDAGEISIPDFGGLNWFAGVPEGSIGDAIFPIGPDPDDLVDFLKAHPNLEASDPKTAEIDGVTGMRIDVRVREDTIGLLLLPDSSLNLGKGQMVRIYALDQGGTTVVLLLQVARERDYEAFLARAKPILRSIQWQVGGTERVATFPRPIASPSSNPGTAPSARRGAWHARG